MAFRQVVLATAPDLVARYPLGSGLGSYPLTFPEVRPWGIAGNVNAAHNDWIQVTCETGLPGAGLGLAVLALLVRGC